MSAKTEEAAPGLGSAMLPLGLSTAVIAGAVAFIVPWEGTRLTPYRDIAGVWTVCNGETRVEMRRYTRSECDRMLQDAVRGTYGRGVLKAVPTLASRPNQLIASISLSYNIGVDAFGRSTVARRFNAGNWKGGCDAFLSWNRSGGRVVQGLVNRREAERKLCLTGL